MPTSLLAVSDAVFALLNVASLKTGLGITVGVKGYVPQPATFPFVFYEFSEKDLGGLGAGPGVKQDQLRVHVFTQYGGSQQAQIIMAEVIRLIEFAEPAATGWTIPKIGRPADVVPIPVSEINGVTCTEYVAIWDSFFAAEPQS